MFKKTLESGVEVEVEDTGELVEIRLIDTDRTAEWLISKPEARAIIEGLAQELKLVWYSQ